MGLFSSVLHVRGTKREKLLPALDEVLERAGFKRAETIPITKKGPFSLPGHDKAINKGPYYLVSELNGDWLTLIEAHFALEDAPDLAGVGKQISQALSTYALTLSVHDDDLFLYNLEHNGESLDGYNSCPQYFESRPLSKAELKAQLHSPEAFAPLLASRREMADLKALLDRGWWTAHDSGKLDRDGVEPDDDDGFVFEGERMIEFGTLLKLHGGDGQYPYAAWGESPIAWPTFVALRYRPGKSKRGRP
jgi:hypothetical protein